MRICYLGDAGSVHMLKWAAHFGRDHDVHVISFRAGDIPNAQVHHLDQLGFLGKSSYVLLIPYIRALPARIQADVVHAMYITSYGFVGAVAGYHPLLVSAWGGDVLVTPHRWSP